MSKFIFAVSKYGAPILAIAAPFVAMAQLKPPPQQLPTLAGFSSLTGISKWLCTISDWMFYFLIILAVIFVVIAAYRYLTSSGDPEKVKGANHVLLYAAIAVLVGLLAYTFPDLVGSIVGSTATQGVQCSA
jgi:uncharacterized membrane protein YidH (DUF202 family)